MKLRISEHIDELIEKALQEDLASVGDITSDSIFSDEKGTFYLEAKQDGVLSGRDLFVAVFHKIDPIVHVDFYFSDGEKLQRGDKVARVSGVVKNILKAERVALNFLSHLSGISTKAARFVAMTRGTSRILDTRKTFPCMRELQKYAVLCGGGKNHRMGLYDMVMIKDNHIDSAGSITEAVHRVRQNIPKGVLVEVETRNLAEVEEALQSKVDIIMLDNMSIEMMKKAVKMTAGKAKVEASGNMTLDRIGEVSRTGVDYISVGELTHSVKAFDFSLKKDRIDMNYAHEITKIKQTLGNSVVIPAHHYVDDSIVSVADFVGDSYKLAVKCSKSDAKNIVFCGVRFMAEAAKALSHEGQRVFSPNKNAGCPLADMITIEQMEKTYRMLRQRITNEIVPVVYVNSNIEVKSFCGRHNGSTCTSSNAGSIMNYYLKKGYVVFFAPDYNLGINTAAELGLQEDQVLRVPRTGEPVYPEKTDNVKLLLWDGYCSVHKKFNIENVNFMRKNYLDIKIIVHPESDREVVKASDMSGSTQEIYEVIKDAQNGSVWAVGTECHFVRRMSHRFPTQTIYPLAESSCNDMQEITTGNLYQVLNALQNNDEKALANFEILITPPMMKFAKKALHTMISIVERCS